MSISPTDAPYRPAYIRDSGGLYYRIGGGSSSGGLPTYFGSMDNPPDPALYSNWVVTYTDGPWDTPIAEGSYQLMISNGTSWFQITGDPGSYPYGSGPYGIKAYGGS